MQALRPVTGPHRLFSHLKLQIDRLWLRSRLRTDFQAQIRLSKLTRQLSNHIRSPGPSVQMAASEQSANKVCRIVDASLAESSLLCMQLPLSSACLVQQYGGWNRRYKHDSEVLGCSMTFTVYYPPAAEKGPVPVRFWSAESIMHAHLHSQMALKCDAGAVLPERPHM